MNTDPQLLLSQVINTVVCIFDLEVYLPQNTIADYGPQAYP